MQQQKRVHKKSRARAQALCEELLSTPAHRKTDQAAELLNRIEARLKEIEAS